MIIDIFIRDDLFKSAYNFEGDVSLLHNLNQGDYITFLGKSKLYQVTVPLTYQDHPQTPYICIREMNVGNAKFKFVLVL